MEREAHEPKKQEQPDKKLSATFFKETAQNQ